MVRRLAIFIVLSLAAPSAAQAAEVTLSGGVLRYKAQPGLVNNINFAESGGDIVLTRVTATDKDPLTGGAGCSPVSADSMTCPGVTRIEADAGDMPDRIEATIGDDPPVSINIPTILTGGDGPDALKGGSRADTIDGGAGNDDIDGYASNDTLRGGDGNDILRPNTGNDAISGGDGVDVAVYGLRVAPIFTLDGLANDGEAGEVDLIGADVEGVSGAASSGIVTIVGDGRANELTVTGGRGDVTGGDGADVLEGGPLDDTLRARDGAPDTVICNGGTDTVEADTVDTISPSCENVSTQATPGGAFDDRPPLIAWVTPAANASLTANSASRLAVNAADDRGLTKVQFFDDDRLLCEVTAAPFECQYTPRGGDVGRNTLIAVAVDGASQTTSLVRAVTVRRFASAGFDLALRPNRDRRAPYAYRATGRLVRPATVSPSHGCSGTVTLTAKRGSRTVATRRTPLSRNCEYLTTIRFRSRVASRLRLTAKFGGNEVLAARAAPSRTIRLG